MYLLSQLVSLLVKLHYIILYLYILPPVPFITHGSWAKVMLLYSVTLPHNMTELQLVKLIWYLYSALPTSPYFGSHL